MKHPAHHISKRLRTVRCGHQALSREITRTVKRIKDDPWFRKLAKELAGHLVEIVVRVLVLSAVNQCIRTHLPARESTRVIPIRPKAIVVP